MAGNWIKFELSTLDKPEVIRISRALGISKEAVCGYLIRFWGWYGDNSVDGVVDGVASQDVDVVLSLPGFADALVAVKWLVEDADSKCLSMPKFDRHNGESSKKRALKASRQARYRDGSVDAPVDAPPSTKVPLDKNREEIKTSAVRGKSAIPDGWQPKIETLQALSLEFKADAGAYVAPFIDACRAKDYRYKDFEAAFRNCVRQDWPKLRVNGRAPGGLAL